MKPKPLDVYTADDLKEFDRITRALSSPHQMVRINARFAVRDFEAKHGEEKCKAMFQVLKERDAKKSRKRKSV